MSVFVQQSGSECEFSNSDSWVKLSPIEQSIKRKIEAVGTPLKNWDIQINYGIKTGFNDAFIINTEKRDEILSNCQTEEERTRTAELIRPILRGRDIKRYGYNWANLWLINTHNGIRGKLERVHIEDYPAIKAHLDQYWDRISKRADKGDTPYNLRNCAYLEDFSKPKIVWGEISDRSKFAYESDGLCVPEATTFLMIGKDLPYLLCMLNSPLAEWFFSKVGTTTGVGTVRWKKYTILELLIPRPNKNTLNTTERLVDDCIKSRINKEMLQELANSLIYKNVGLDNKEIEYIESYYPHLCSKD